MRRPARVPLADVSDLSWIEQLVDELVKRLDESRGEYADDQEEEGPEIAYYILQA
jgi:hypothetical protein